MIISAPEWQDELGRLSANLRDSFGSTKDHFNGFEFERSLYYIAISLRKLNDTVLRPRDFSFYGWSIDGNRYLSRGKELPSAWWFAVDVNFDMNLPRPCRKAMGKIVDMIMHSRFVDCSHRTRSIIVGSEKESQQGPFIFEFKLDHFSNHCSAISKQPYNQLPRHGGVNS